MRVLICHERFIGRYGADRVLLILARALRRAGAHVTLMGARIDEREVEGAADAIVHSPLDVAAPELDARTSDWLAREWTLRQDARVGFDLVIVGGWPFFSAIPLFRALADGVLFIDFGVVPRESYPVATRDLLQHLLRLRSMYLPACTHIAAISLFVLRSQSLVHAGRGSSFEAVHLGVDHLPDVSATPAGTPEILERLRQQGRRAVLLLGRFEPVGYKDSAVAFEVLSAVREVDPSVALLVLEPHERLTVPAALRDHVFGIGYPSDEALVHTMRACAVGWSVSRWEGFNLPLAEMFWLQRPALAFRLAAHPEVVPDDWFLVDDVEDMAARTLWILADAPQVPALTEDALCTYREYFTWARFVQEIADLVGLPIGCVAPDKSGAYPQP